MEEEATGEQPILGHKVNEIVDYDVLPSHANPPNPSEKKWGEDAACSCIFWFLGIFRLSTHTPGNITMSGSNNWEEMGKKKLIC